MLIFHTAINLDETFVKTIILSYAVLHNFVRQRDGYQFEDTLTCPLDDIPIVGTGGGSLVAKQTRDVFADYFISPSGTKVKLEITLTFLASGMSFRNLSHFYRVSIPSISNLIPEVCWAIYESLKTQIKMERMNGKLSKTDLTPGGIFPRVTGQLMESMSISCEAYISRFRVFENAIPTSLNTVDAIVCASCALHNWLRKNSYSYITPTCVDREDSEGQIIPGTWRSEITPLISINDQRRGNHSVNAKEKRDLLKTNSEYFRNRKGCFSLSVQVVVDSDLRIRYIVVRWPGSTHDPTIFNNSSIKARFEANEFENAQQAYNFLCAIGAIDCTHIPILKPAAHGDEYINRKGFPSLNVLASCNSSEVFTSVDISWPGSVHDARIWTNSTIQPVISRNQVRVLLLGDSGFGIAPWLMTPFRTPNNPQQQAFNNLLTRERVIIERCFGQVKQRFPILQYKIRLATEKVPHIIACCFILHNVAKYLKDSDFPAEENHEENFNGAQIEDKNIRISWVRYRLGETTVREIVYDTCQKIWDTLRPLVMPTPSLEQWQKIEEGFRTKWNYPNCVGAIDGKYVVFEKPPNTGSQFYNYKKEFSIVLLALVDADYRFITVDVGGYGRNSDGRIFRSSQLGKKLLSNQLNLPEPKPLPQTNIILPHVIVGDEAFPLLRNVMRPYPGAQTGNNQENRIYNYRHCRARRLALHCITINLRNDSGAWQPGELEREDEVEGLDDLPNIGGNFQRDAFNIREQFKQFFVSNQGSVPWQLNRINAGILPT
nr:unnamed protein product [Callosobruchus chinensis]